MLSRRCMRLWARRVTILAFASIALLPSCRLPADDTGTPCITNVRVFPIASAVRIFVDLNQALQFSHREIKAPPGLVVEIPGASSKAPAAPISVGREPVREIAVFASEGARPARVEVWFSAPAKWNISTTNEDKRIVITVEPDRAGGPRTGAPTSKEETRDSTPSGGEPAGRSSSTLRNIPEGTSGGKLECSFKDTDLHDVIQVISKLVEANIVADASVQGRVTLTLSNIGWEEGLSTALKSLGYALVKDGNIYVVTRSAPEQPPTVSVESGKLSVSAEQVDIKRLLAIISEKSGLNIVTSPSVDGKVSVQLSNVPVEDGLYTFLSANGYSFRKLQDIFVVDKLEGGPKAKPPMRPYRQPTSGKLTIDFKDTELSEVLSDLAAQSGKNIVSYGQLSDKITIRLVDVSLDEALRLVLAGTKYACRQVGEAFVVGDATNLASPVAQMLTVTEIIPLKYIKADECPKYLSGVVPAANIKPLKEQNSLLVVGTEEMIARIKQEIALVDRVAPQIMIEAQIIEVSSNASKNLGIEFQASEGKFSAKLPGTGQVVYTSTAALSRSLIATLQALVSEGKARVLASPKITTINGREANITISQQRYFRTSYVPQYNTGQDQGQNNNQPNYYPYYPYSQVQSVEAGIMLRIVPFVGASDEITVDIEPEVSNVTGTGPDGLPEVSRRKASTTVRVKNGETIIIGGLKQREQSKAVTRTPILSEIPIIGELFKSRTKNTREADLMILITPTLISADNAESGAADHKEEKSTTPQEQQGSGGEQPAAAKTGEGGDSK